MGIAPTLHRDPGPPGPFRSDDDLFESARSLFHARILRAKTEHDDDASEEKVEKARFRDRAWTRYWHRSLEVSETSLSRRLEVNGLDRSEKEIVVAVVLGALDLIEEGAGDVEEILRLLRPTGRRVLPVLRSLSESGTLARSGLIALSGLDDPPLEWEVEPAPELIETVMGRPRSGMWKVRNERELEKRLASVTKGLYRKVDLIKDVQYGWKDPAALKGPVRSVQQSLEGLRRTLRSRRGFRMAKLFTAARFKKAERIVLLALLGRELGHLPSDCSLFTRIGLVRASVDESDEITTVLPSLSSKGRLVRDGWIEKDGGGADEGDDNERDTLTLGPRAMKILGRVKPVPRCEGPGSVLEPRVPMSSLVLCDDSRRMLDMALAQIRHNSILLDDWGLKKTFPYGRAVTLLFQGPPGTGKTAAAEALAHETGKELLSARYDQLQSRWIGETEKSIVQIFLQAIERDAVLFWDEADAMFFDRGTTDSPWEIRHVNVLLTELERFEGVCVLATNRAIKLDAAVERRITLKIPFPRPGLEERIALWKILVPPEFPLGRDVDLAVLAGAELSGGEIKNAVLNTARMAVSGGRKKRIGQEDFLRAIDIERKRISGKGGRIGFAH